MQSNSDTAAFDRAFATVRGLAADFRAGQTHFLSATYKEEEARKDFMDKFWIALGWDVNHDKQRNPYEQEVKVERGVAMSEGKKRADYAFTLAPDYRRIRFYVEAKKPSVEIRSPDHYFQAIRYGWNGGTPLAVLTDFEQFHILDSRRKPDISDVLDRAVRQYHFSDYEDPARFAEIYYLFGREAVASGAIERFAEAELPSASGGGRAIQRGLFNTGTQSIDESFLKDLEEYRGVLARAFKEANPHLESESLTEATQRTLDRLVFIRFLEDKLIVPEPLLRNITAKPSAWRAFQAERSNLDRQYNGNIFKAHFIDKPDFMVEDAVFRGICEWLASDQSPYLFSVVPIYILGSIYERFLGSVITDEGRPEQKPEVRKAGGVYYTPDYIVRYIIENSVGRQIANRTPEEIKALRFADIACGSGSFLLEVYDELLRYHTAYYNRGTATEAKKAGCERDDETGTWRLSLYQRREILLNNIYGVDIDPQAVEVAQLSLYLKLLESETTASARAAQLTLGGAILPTLTGNIVCGNALVEWDIFGDGEMNRKINPLDFRTTFAAVMRQGGFDAIVGNPPYIRIQTMQETLPETIPYYKTKYAAAAKGNYDIYVLFIERALQLTKASGIVGYIVPNKFIKTDYGEGLRKIIAQRGVLNKVVDFGSSQVFASATIYTCLLFLMNHNNSSFDFATANAEEEALRQVFFVNFLNDTLSDAAWTFDDGITTEIIKKMQLNSHRLLDLPSEMSRGSSSGDDKIFLIDPNTIKIEDGILRTPLFASEFNRYSFSLTVRGKIIFPYIKENGSMRLYSEVEMQSSFPNAYQYLLNNKKELEKRKHKGKWYAFSAPRNLILHENAQIAIPLLADKGIFALIPEETHGTLCPMASGGFTITLGEGLKISPHYVLGLMNSRLLFWFLRRISNVFRGGWITCTKQYLGELPIRTINFSDPRDTERHDRMTALVTAMIDVKQKRARALTDRDIQFFDRRIFDLDRQIDRLVYELYDLSAADIALVEAA